MKCTCKDWNILDNEHSESKLQIASKGLGYKFCPWCGSPLLPDPVEKVKWKVESSRLDSDFDSSEAGGMLTLSAREKEFPNQTHTLKSITTIERVLKLVKPR